MTALKMANVRDSKKRPQVYIYIKKKTEIKIKIIQRWTMGKHM